MATDNKEDIDPYIGVKVFGDYVLTKKVGEGKIGFVYRAERSSPTDVYACKIVPEHKLKHGWQKELDKLVRLRRLPYIVQYHTHGHAEDLQFRPFTWIIFDFIKGINLNEYLINRPFPLDMAFIENLADKLLQMLHACQAVEVQHGDLHEGNILIEDPDSRRLGSPRTIWVSDFGYGGSHNDITPKNDFKQVFAIVSTLLRKLEPHALNPRDKLMHAKLKAFMDKRLIEQDPTQGEFVGNAETLHAAFLRLSVEAERESIAATDGESIKEPGDYLWAEALGYRADEWQDLFVPEFLAAQELLTKNITVLTGARGCGKTMSFRRLTAYMDKVVGDSSGVAGADQFVGFYVNCREFAEAFPWLPTRLNKAAEQQLIHYFHLAWLSEILKTLGAFDPEGTSDYGWLDSFLTATCPDAYKQLPQGTNILNHARAFIEDEKERCRLVSLGTSDVWPLARFDVLDALQQQMESHLPWIGNKPIYFFLDDYTIPIVPREVQRALNPIVFRRRDKLFFKVSTEAAISFDLRGFRGKHLEVFHDFNLIDLATESLHQSERAKTQLLEKIFKPRIDRHTQLRGKGLGLANVLGPTNLSNNALARQIRSNAQKNNRKRRIVYQGVRAFVGMWSSDIRTMIQMFTDILREVNGQVGAIVLPIKHEAQTKILRAKGGEFLAFAGSSTDPSRSERGPSSTRQGDPFGTHLVSIVEAFVAVSRHELTKGSLVNNEGRSNPKQAFRLEILDKLDLPPSASRYYYGLVRWHIFLQDWRGKSVRGMITPRLYLNRVLIPHAYLSFSTRDNIHLTNDEFVALLERPNEFRAYWEGKRLKGKKRKGTEGSEPTFWDI